MTLLFLNLVLVLPCSRADVRPERIKTKHAPTIYNLVTLLYTCPLTYCRRLWNDATSLQFERPQSREAIVLVQLPGLQEFILQGWRPRNDVAKGTRIYMTPVGGGIGSKSREMLA
jgi:hypothetical protein